MDSADASLKVDLECVNTPADGTAPDKPSLISSWPSEDAADAA